MKTTAVLSLLGAALASAQFTNQSAPFYLKYILCPAGTEETYLFPCHSGAGQAGLCPEGSWAGNDNSTTHSQFFHNETSSDFDGLLLGALTWNLPIGNGDPISSALDLQLQIVSNGAIPIFSPGDLGLFTFGFDTEEKLFIVSSQDDSTAVPGNATYTQAAYYHWHVCWTFVGNYYYKSLVWITAGAPTNPTCEPVVVSREWAESP